MATTTQGGKEQGLLCCDPRSLPLLLVDCPSNTKGIWCKKTFFFFTSFRARGPRKDEKRERWMASRENVLFQRKCFEIMLKSHGNLIGIDRLKKKAQHFKVFSTKKIRTNIDNNNYIGQLFLAVTTSFYHRKVLFWGARNIVYSIIVQRLLYMVLYRSEYCTCLKIRFFGVLDYCT